MNRWLFPFALLAVLAGCGQQQDPQQEAARAPERIQTATRHAAWLSRQLPAETVAYLRLPNPLELLTAPRGHVLTDAQAHTAHQQQIDAIRNGLIAQIEAAAPGVSALPNDLLLQQRMPVLEVAALQPMDGSLVPDVLLGTTLAIRSLEEFGGWLEQTIQHVEGSRVLTPVDASGQATVLAGPMPLYLSFDASNGRLLALTGFAATAERLAAYAAPTEPALQGVLDHEGDRDAAGLGLALWADPARAWPLIEPTLPPLQAETMRFLGLDQATSLWLGSRSSGGRGEWAVELIMPEVGFRQFLPRVGQAAPLTTAGDPRWALRVALPSADEINGIVDLVLQNTMDGTMVRDEIQKSRDQFREYTGFEFDDLFNALGPDFSWVSDEAGTWMAVRVRDRAALTRVLAGLEERAEIAPVKRSVSGMTINYWTLPSMFSDLVAESTKDDPGSAAAAAVLGRLRNHVFWVEKGDLMILASVPQILIDRAASERPGQMEEWLQADQDLDWSGALAAAVMTRSNLPRDLYNTYLQLLLGVADLVEVDIDPLALASAGQLDLPDSGRFGVRIDSTADRFGMALSYEYSPMDALLAGDVFTASAVTGILAAIAIPAYSDYTLRAKVAEALNASAMAKLLVSEFRLVEGRFPSNKEEAGLTDEPLSEYIADIVIEGATITLVLQNIGDAVDGGFIVLEGTADEAAVHWQCRGDQSSVPQKFLPATCRTE